ncbi:MAG TPA: phage tail protein [Kofleriaceae bacterium]|nr:phage tail protein [Kofleriaceae bacterium]
MTDQPPASNVSPRAYAAAHFALELDDMKNLGMFRSIEGGSIKAEVMTYQNGGTYDRWRQLGKPKFEDLKLQLGMAMSQPFYEWIKQFFAGKALRKDGAIVAADFYYKERARRQFSNAMITELTFPKLDGSDKNTAYMSVALSVEDIQFIKGSGAALEQNAGLEEQKSWKACNFRFSMDGFDCLKRVTKVESFTVKQQALEYAMGGSRWASKTPSAIDFPQLSFSLPEVDAQPLMEHFTKRGVKGEVPGRLSGQIETYDNQQTTCFTIQFMNADIMNIAPDKSDSTTEEIKQVKVDLYVESMAFNYSGV